MITTRRFAIGCLMLGYVLLAAGFPGEAAAQVKPEGEMRWALYVTLSPVWFDPGEVVGQLTPFWVLYALHDALVKPMPGNQMTPSLADAGYPGIQASAGFMVVAPAGTPPEVIRRMSVEINRVMKSPAVREKLDSQGFIPVFDTPEAFAVSLKRQRQRWAEVIRRHKIVVE